MFEITITDDFAAAHRLKNYNGACENLHGHNFIVEVSVLCDTLNEAYIAIDFKVLKNMVKEILNKLDHTYLNEISYFKKTNPTSEIIAKYIYEQLKNKLNGKSCKPFKVSVYESLRAKASYFEDHSIK